MRTSRLTLICAAADARQAQIFPDDAPLDPREPAPARLGRVDAAWTSPAGAARQTASWLGLDAAVSAALRECDHGRWRGRGLAEVSAAEPEALAAWVGDPAAAPHGGESLLAVLARVAAWLDAQRGTSGHTVAVTHPAAIRAAVVHVLDAPPAALLRIDVVPLARTRLTAHAGRWRLRGLNLPERA